eukprot:861581-Prorocentrum_minimum.AAC.1
MFFGNNEGGSASRPRHAPPVLRSHAHASSDPRKPRLYIPFVKVYMKRTHRGPSDSRLLKQSQSRNDPLTTARRRQWMLRAPQWMLRDVKGSTVDVKGSTVD